MKPGDIMETNITGIGILRNRIGWYATNKSVCKDSENPEVMGSVLAQLLD
jgi:hypothetical protein